MREASAAGEQCTHRSVRTRSILQLPHLDATPRGARVRNALGMGLAGPTYVNAARAPYCGVAPLPGEIAGRWNLDPPLLASLAVIVLLYAVGAHRVRGAEGTGPRRAAFFAGWALCVLAWVSPLCGLGVALFSARIGQHLLLSFAAAPLLVLGRPDVVLRALLHRSAPPGSRWSPAAAWAACSCFAAAFWFWHAPGPYATTFRSDTAYWLMHLSVLGSGYGLWAAWIRGAAERPFHALLLGVATSLQLGCLGALLTFAPTALFTPHRHTTAPWGFSALADQQLGGLLCWIPGCAVFLIAGLAPLAAWLRAREAAGPHFAANWGGAPHTPISPSK